MYIVKFPLVAHLTSTISLQFLKYTIIQDTISSSHMVCLVLLSISYFVYCMFQHLCTLQFNTRTIIQLRTWLRTHVVQQQHTRTWAIHLYTGMHVRSCLGVVDGS